MTPDWDISDHPYNYGLDLLAIVWYIYIEMKRKLQDLIETYKNRLNEMEDDAMATGRGKIELLTNVIEDLENILNSL